MTSCASQLTVAPVIGLTLVVSGDSFFLTLFVVIVFHQMFEGIALGTRIAALGHNDPTVITGHHAHGQGHCHTNPVVVAPVLAKPATPTPHATGSDCSTSDQSVVEAPVTPHAHHKEAPAAVGKGTLWRKKFMLAMAFALVTPIGMAVGIGVLQNFNGNDKSTIVAIGTLDALSAGILVWVGVVEMLAHDWMMGGEMTKSGPLRTGLGLVSLIAGLAVMSLLGKWA